MYLCLQKERVGPSCGGSPAGDRVSQQVAQGGRILHLAAQQLLGEPCTLCMAQVYHVRGHSCHQSLQRCSVELETAEHFLLKPRGKMSIGSIITLCVPGTIRQGKH